MFSPLVKSPFKKRLGSTSYLLKKLNLIGKENSFEVSVYMGPDVPWFGHGVVVGAGATMLLPNSSMWDVIRA